VKIRLETGRFHEENHVEYWTPDSERNGETAVLRDSSASRYEQLD